jgi:hypothetical protein
MQYIVSFDMPLAAQFDDSAGEQDIHLVQPHQPVLWCEQHPRDRKISIERASPVSFMAVRTVRKPIWSYYNMSIMKQRWILTCKSSRLTSLSRQGLRLRLDNDHHGITDTYSSDQL